MINNIFTIKFYDRIPDIKLPIDHKIIHAVYNLESEQHIYCIMNMSLLSDTIIGLVYVDSDDTLVELPQETSIFGPGTTPETFMFFCEYIILQNKHNSPLVDYKDINYTDDELCYINRVLEYANSLPYNHQNNIITTFIRIANFANFLRCTPLVELAMSRIIKFLHDNVNPATFTVDEARTLFNIPEEDFVPENEYDTFDNDDNDDLYSESDQSSIEGGYYY